MTEQELYEYHESVFKPIYADLVAVLGSKPEQIAFELEAALSHIVVANVKKSDSAVYDENIRKAHGHFQRAALDAAKILWLEYKSRAEKIVLDPDLRALASNSPEHDLLQKYEEAESLVKRARKIELANTGQKPSEAVEHYYTAAIRFNEVLSNIDSSKVTNIDRLKRKLKARDIIISFIVGLISGLFVEYLLKLL